MGAFLMLIDAILLFFFLLMATAPIVDAQLVLPLSLFPEWMVEYKNWYVGGFNDYCYVEKPHFFIGLILVELVFQWPLALAMECWPESRGTTPLAWSMAPLCSPPW
ncbi:hypothetical protein ACLB2K_062173 [Fragaria x ananassa]